VGDRLLNASNKYFTDHSLARIPANPALQIAGKSLSLAVKIATTIWRRAEIDPNVAAGSLVSLESRQLGCG
jgi:hypothetical protein